MPKDQRPLEDIYMHLSNGKKYYPFAPRVEDVDINVIAHHLATRARYAGATQHPEHPDRIFYSVAEHSVYCARVMFNVLRRPDLAMVALLHDAAEAFNGDLIRPLKYSEEFAKPFKRVEEMNEAVIAQAFGLPYPFPKEVKMADEMVGLAEYEQIVPRAPEDKWLSDGGYDAKVPAAIEIEMMLPADARNFFLHTYRLLAAVA